ncbi:urease accessory protein UreF [Candidatus Methanomassiliicoccus intestinalis]|uniref:urease accessory protein UreF n=1 Tax=Candidatus Methanomassiliicoccus intestinalis TaxID=1406512 RepID=UPI0037DD2064
MHTEALMNLMRISDSFFPVGSFTVSQGMEQFVADDLVTDSNLMSILEAYVNNIWVPLEMPIFKEALEAVIENDLERLLAVDRLCYASKLTEEGRETSVKMGNNLISMVESSEIGNSFQNLVKDHSTPGTYPVSLAVLANELKIDDAGEYSLLYVNLMEIAAAMVRMGEIDYLSAQNLVKSVITKISTPPPFGEEYQSFPLADIESMRHENSSNRMFMS